MEGSSNFQVQVFSPRKEWRTASFSSASGVPTPENNVFACSAKAPAGLPFPLYPSF
jgi:hypothetical protein